MTGYRKKNFTGKSKRRSVRYDGFCLFGKPKDGQLKAASSLNCDCVDGVLKTGVGFINYKMEVGYTPVVSIAADVENMYLVKGTPDSIGVRTEYLFLITGDDVLYEYMPSQSAWYQKFSVDAGAQIATVADGDLQTRSLLIGAENAFCFQDGSFEELSLSYTLPAVCECKSRAFVAVKPYTLMFSDPSAPWVFESSDEDGKIPLPSGKGKIVALLNFEDDIYAFFEYGIMQLRVAGAAKDFQVRAVAYSGDCIFGNSVGICDDAIMFLAADGVYRLDGKGVKKVCEEMKISPKRRGQVCNHAVCGDKFLLRYVDEYDERRVAVLHGDGSGGYYATDMEGLSDCAQKALCRKGYTVMQVVESGSLMGYGSYEFESEEFDLGVEGKKTLTELVFEGEGDFSYRIWADGYLRRGHAYFYDGVVRIPCMARGETFRLQLTLYEDTQIRGVTVSFTTVE